MKNLSLQIRLIIFFVIIAGFTWGAAAIVSLKEYREEIDEFFDTYQLMLGRQLASADWRHITPQTQLTADKIIDDIEDADMEDEAIAFAIFEQNGKMVFNDNEEGKKFSFRPGQELGTFQKVKVKDEDWRILWLPSVDGRYVIAVGQELEYREDMALEVIEELLTPWLLGLGVLLLATIFMVSWELRPLKRIASEISSRSSEDLSPLQAKNLPSEITPLMEALNWLLERIAQMLKKERSFISDSAHELRSPLTALKIQLEVAQLSEDGSSERMEALQKLEQGIDRSIHLVEQLLSLSRLEQSEIMQQENLSELDWKQIIASVADGYKEKISEKSLKLETEEKETPFSYGNPVLCSLLLRNLLDNAVKYSPEKGEIRIIMEQGSLEVINTSAEIKPEVLNRIKERFYRPAGQKESGSGLGLAIAEKIASLHGCQLVLKSIAEGFSAKVIKTTDAEA